MIRIRIGLASLAAVALLVGCGAAEQAEPAAPPETTTSPVEVMPDITLASGGMAEACEATAYYVEDVDMESAARGELRLTAALIAAELVTIKPEVAERFTPLQDAISAMAVAQDQAELEQAYAVYLDVKEPLAADCEAAGVAAWGE